MADDLRAVTDGDAATLVRFANRLAELDRSAADADAHQGLARLIHAPRLVTRLDESLRSWRAAEPRDPVDRLVAEFDSGRRTPTAVALASLDGDGRRRERAVRAMADRPVPALVPFLVLRAGDWAWQVSRPARAALATLLDAAPGVTLPAAAPITRHLAGRLRGGFATAWLAAATMAASDAVRRQLAESRSVLDRRLAFDADRQQNRLTAADLAAIATRESDSVIRSAAAGVVCRDAVWRADAKLLRTLAGARWADVRALALTGLVRLGRDAEVTELGLDDTSGLVRAAARAAARRAGIDVEAHYRSAAPSAGAIAGLAEIGITPDVALLRHPAGRVRAAAVRALATRSAVPVDEVLPLLRDPAPAVVREATAALRPLQRLLPDGLGDRLMSDPRPEVRLAGFRLIAAGPSGAARSAAVQRLIADEDPRLARRGRSFLAGRGVFGPMN